MKDHRLCNLDNFTIYLSDDIGATYRTLSFLLASDLCRSKVTTLYFPNG